MTTLATPTCIAFEGERRLAAGALGDVALAVRKRAAQGALRPILVFDFTTGQQLDLDLRGTDKDIRARFAATSPAALSAPDEPTLEAPRRPGRPKLGVVAREVTLLPRHWDWLNAQPGGASVALRRLVEDARRTKGRGDALRARREAAYRFMLGIAGNLPDYDEANRALFAGDPGRFAQLTDAWPVDIRDHARRLASAAFAVKAART
jgi:uncharacterized protein